MPAFEKPEDHQTESVIHGPADIDHGLVYEEGKGKVLGEDIPVVVPIDGFLSRLLPRKTSWTFSTSAGLSGGFGPLSLGGGTLFLRDDSNPRDELFLRYAAIGASVTPQIGPLKNVKFSVAGSLKSFPGRGVGHIYAGPRVSFSGGDLAFHDMVGFINLLSASLVAGSSIGPSPSPIRGFGVGFALTIIFLNTIPGATNVLAGLGGASMQPHLIFLALLAIAEISAATGLLVGSEVGRDVSLSALQGVTVGEGRV